MLGWILLGSVILGAVALFVVQAQRSSLHHQIAAVLVAGGGVLLVAFFALPWVSLQGGLGLIGNLAGSLIPPDLLKKLEGTGILQELNRVIDDQSLITGWKLAAEIPTVGTFLQFTLFTIPATGVLALVVSALAYSEQPITQPLSLLLLVLSIVSAGLLFSVLRSIRILGVDPGLFMPILDLLGIHFGPGVWFSFVGLAICALGGLLLSRQPIRSGDARKRRSQLGRRRR